MLNQRKHFVLYCNIHATFALVFACFHFLAMVYYIVEVMLEPNPKQAWIWLEDVALFASLGTWLFGVWLAHRYAARCIKNLRYPVRTQLIVATNLITLLVMCIVATWLPVLVFGVVYMRHRHVRWAYAEVAKGRTVEDVLATAPPKTFGDERDDYDDAMHNG